MMTTTTTMAAITWDNLGSLPLAILALLAAASVVVWAYRPQVLMMDGLSRWVLPMLRTVAIVALLASILKPVMATTATQAQRGAVVMVVDTSRSMSLTDARRPAERVALARSLGQLPARDEDDWLATLGVRMVALTTALDEWQRTQDEVRFATATGRSSKEFADRAERATAALKAARQRAIEVVDRQKDHPDLVAVVRGMTNTKPADMRSRANRITNELATARAREDALVFGADPAARSAADALATTSRVQLAGRAMAELARTLPADVPLYAYAAGDDVGTLGVDLSARAVIPANALHTDTASAIASVLRRLDSVPIRGVVLWSDGRQVDPSDEPAAGGPVAPVFAVNVVPIMGGPRDVSVQIVEAPQRMFVKESGLVRVAVQARAVPSGPIDVQLRAGEIVETKKLLLDGQNRGGVEFAIEPTAGGLLNVEARVLPLPDEITTDNNVDVRRVRVLQEKLKVAAYAGSPTWDFQYLRNALQRCPWAQVSEGIVNAQGVTLPLTSDQILQQNVVVLSDVDVAMLDASQWDALNRLVTIRGGSVIIMANDERTMTGYATQPQAANLLPLRAGLKYAWRTWSGERPTLRVAPAEGSALSRWLSDDPAESARRWQSAGALFRVMPLAGLKPNAQPLLVETESGVPVLTDARIGAGRSLFVGLNETWRWRWKVGERDQDRFLLQLIRYAADEPYAARAGNVAIDVSAATIHPGEPVTLRALILDAEGCPSSATSATVRVKRDGEPGADIELSQVAPTGMGRFETRVTDLPSGRYEFSIVPVGSVTGPSVELFVEPDALAELRDVSADVPFLQRLAESTGGAYSTIDDTPTLAAQLETAGPQRNAFVQRPLWDSPYLFAFVLACLGTEWALRKRAGLA